MAVPRAFISSTCYDLKYIRENLKYLIKTIGYEPILSEEGAVFYNPRLDTHSSCLAEIPHCQLFILIIGGRYGAEYSQGGSSVTNAEYHEAVRLKLPIFALLDSNVHSDYELFCGNEANQRIDRSNIVFRSVDSIKIFDFIAQVRANAFNNALFPFRDFTDIQQYLKQQWAGMMYDFLTRTNEERRVADTLSALAEMNTRIEMLSKQILRSVGTEDAKLEAAFAEMMLSSKVVREFADVDLRIAPANVLVNASFRACIKALGGQVKRRKDRKVYAIRFTNFEQHIVRVGFEELSRDYNRLREGLKKILAAHSFTTESYLTQKPQTKVEAGVLQYRNPDEAAPKRGL